MRRFLLSVASLLVLSTANASAQGKDGGGITPMCVSGCLGGIMVTPDGTPVEVLGNTSGYVAEFVVKNTGSSYASATLTCSTSGPFTCTGLSQGSVSLDPNEEIDVTVTYSAGEGGYGEVGLSSGTDYGWYTVTSIAVGPPTIALQNHNGTNGDRGLCMTTGAGEAAGISCGDLFVTHGMPVYRTLGRDRSLSLIYNSAAATGLVLVAANVSQPAGRQTPLSVRLILTVGSAKDSATYTAFGAGQTQQVVIGRRITGLATGVYPMTLTARNIYGGSTFETTVTGTILIVNRETSEFGRGWSLLGLEQVLTDPADSTRRVWVTGDGSIRLYTKPSLGSNIFQGAAGDAPDSLIRFDTLVSGSTQKWYRRNLKHGAAVTFDATGRHRFTQNRVGARTLFTWSTVAGQTRLATITVPPNDATARNYTFYWKSTTARLDSIRDPGARRLKLAMAVDTLKSLTDPDGQVTRFQYSAGRMAKRIYPRKGMKGDTASTSFTYANQARVTAVSIQADSAAVLFAVTALTPWDERGLADLVFSTSSAGAPTTAVGLPSRVDGPITGLGDASDILVNRFGQPTKLTDLGLNTVTTVWYDSTVSLPALPTKVQYPHASVAGAGGRIVRMSWNARGNLTEQRDSTYFLDGRPTKVTSYTYASGSAPDSPTRVQDALGRHTDYAYTALGLTDSTIDPRLHRTKYGYTPSGPLTGLPTSVTERSVQTWVQATGSETTQDQTTSLTYDVNGNPLTMTSPAGAVTSYVADNLGRITDVYDPLGTRSGHAYDMMNRDTLQTTYTTAQAHPSVPNPLSGCVPSQFICADVTAPFTPTLPTTLLTKYRFTSSGMVDSILDPRNVKRKYVYDARLNVQRERDEFDHDKIAYYNVNGLLDSVKTRRGFVTRYRYDPTGRRTAMIYPERQDSVPGDTLAVIPGDSLSYTYDLLGNVLVSRNQAGHTITRTYWADGAPKTKKTAIQFSDSLYYEYDATGARTLMVTMAQDSTRYFYGPVTGVLDSMRVRMTSSGSGTTPATRVFTFAYDGLGRRRQIIYPYGITVWYAYDALGTLRRVASTNPADVWGATDRFDFTFLADSVDPIGRVLHQQTACTSWNSQDTRQLPCGASGSARSITHRYDRRSSLVFQLDELKRDSMHFDASGNMVYRYQSSGGYPGRDSMIMLPNSNRIASDTNMAAHWRVNHTYDADGARVMESPTPNNQGNTTLWKFQYYDAIGRNSGYRKATWNQTTQRLDVEGHPTSCGYDPEGAVSHACPSDASWTTNDGPNPTAMVNGWRLVHAPGVDELLMGRYALGSVRRTIYFVMDGSGRQLAMGDSAGQMTEQDLDAPDQSAWKYAGATQNGSTFDATRMGNADQPGVSYFRNRAYDSRTGRWLQEDPIGVAGGLNLYQFNGNNPVAYTDPFGLCPDSLSSDDKKCKAWDKNAAAASADSGSTIEKVVAKITPESLIPVGQCIDRYTSTPLGLGVVANTVVSTVVGGKARVMGASVGYTSWQRLLGRAVDAVRGSGEAFETAGRFAGRASLVVTGLVGGYDIGIVVQCGMGTIK